MAERLGEAMATLLKSAAFLASTLLLLAPLIASTAIAGSPSTETPIKHVIIMMMENHSFDNIFGTYPITNLSSQGNPLGIEVPNNLIGSPYLSLLSPLPPSQTSTADPVEGYQTYTSDWNNGQMNGFYNNSGPQSMTYFTSAQMALEWSIAEQYALGDMYFSSMMSMTTPNRLLSLAGTTPVNTDAGPPPYIPLASSIFGELDQYHISWGYYSPVGTGPFPPYPLNFFKGIMNSSGAVDSVSGFYAALAGNSLPSVSWVMPLSNGNPVNDQHPPFNITLGEFWMASIINAVMESPYWSSSAIFITYDEGGGYFDHVPPPVVDGHQLGFRIPLIVVSPYAKEDYVSGTVLNHASLLAFIDYNWKMPSLNSFVANSNLPLDFFNFGHLYPDGKILRPAVPFREVMLFPIQPQYPFLSLPYPRSGSSSTTLLTLGTPPYTPGYSAGWIEVYLLLIAGAVIVSVPAVYVYRRRR